MKKPYIIIGRFGFVLSLILTTGIFLHAASIPSFKWGMKMHELQQSTTSSGIALRRFSPQERPRYKNKIMRYILSVDPTVDSKMIVMRHRGKVIRDYLFVNQRLYTVLDDMGEISGEEVREIVRSLNGKFGKATVEKDKYLTVRSYKNSSTKVMFYSKLVDDGKYKCKIYFYATSMFRMLIMDN